MRNRFFSNRFWVTGASFLRRLALRGYGLRRRAIGARQPCMTVTVCDASCPGLNESGKRRVAWCYWQYALCMIEPRHAS